MDSDSDFDVVICGAGPVGLMLSIGSVAKIVGEASRSAQTIKLRQFTRRSGTNLR
jgi:threonine dehydrogenase-like Zn-dependent dehydrogenase